jgi:hypothetical protein
LEIFLAQRDVAYIPKDHCQMLGAIGLAKKRHASVLMQPPPGLQVANQSYMQSHTRGRRLLLEAKLCYEEALAVKGINGKEKRNVQNNLAILQDLINRNRLLVCARTTLSSRPTFLPCSAPTRPLLSGGFVSNVCSI